jgi:hypothetical protein
MIRLKSETNHSIPINNNAGQCVQADFAEKW